MRDIPKVHCGNSLVPPQTEVYVYKNLHKACWSVRSSHSGIVLCHCSYILLLNATFHVSERGRQRVIREKTKNVHAGIRGTTPIKLSSYQEQLDLILDLPPEDKDFWKYSLITYDPYKYSSFVDVETEEPKSSARIVEMMCDKELTTIISILTEGAKDGRE
jgi:hypothetical protein